MADVSHQKKSQEHAPGDATGVLQESELSHLHDAVAPARKIRVLIADDQQIACEVLKRLLRSEEDVELVGTCASGPETLEAIKRLNPDLVFLDVQMPGMDGFEVLDQLPPNRSPMVVFVTANEAYAGRALKAHADFVLKPCTRERVRTALRHALARGGPKKPGEDF
jgi:two-component system LytT family response regulator